MHRFVLAFVATAAFLTAWAITEAQYRVHQPGHLLIPDPYLPLLRITALGLWLIAAVAVAAKHNRDAAARYQALQTGQIQASNRYLVEAVTMLTDAVLSDVDQKKRVEIEKMLDDYGIDTKSGQENVTRRPTTECDQQNMIEFQRRKRSTGDR